MAFIKTSFASGALVALVACGGFAWWTAQPLRSTAPIDFTIAPGSGANAAAQQMAQAGVPINPFMFQILARISGQSARIKAGSYELKPNTSPRRLLTQLVRGEFAQEALTIIEGWSFRQMRDAVNAAKNLRHDTATLSDAELMAKLSTDFSAPEGLFFPDTYLFAKGASDLQIYKQAHQMMLDRLQAAWDKREANLPYKNPYQALIMASIVEKETGQKSERGMIAGVFVNRLRVGMMLQTDPSVIYGMGQRYAGKITKKDLQTDTAFNTYTRFGLPPTPISLPGVQSLAAAMAPAQTEAVYFVSRNDGTSKFSTNLNDHNRAVNQYQRGASKP